MLEYIVGNERLLGKFKNVARAKNISVEELVEKLESGEIGFDDPKIRRLNAELGGQLAKMIEEVKNKKEENKEPELTEDDKFFEAVKVYTHDFQFLSEGPDILEGIEGHRKFDSEEHKKRYTKLLLKMLECKKELGSGRYESEEQFLKRIVNLCNSKYPERKEMVEYRIYKARLDAIEKQKENDKYYR